MKVERREREIARTREDILNAAERAFSRGGFQATTMQDIAHEAGYTAAALYTYFRSKSEIVEGLVHQLTTEFAQIFDQPIPEGLSFQQRFDIVIRRQLELTEQRRSLLINFHSGQLSMEFCPSDSHNKLLQGNFEFRIQRLAKWFDDYAKPEDIGGHDSDTAARLLFGMGFGLLYQRMSEEKHDARLTDLAPIIRDLFFYGVCGKPKARAKKK